MWCTHSDGAGVLQCVAVCCSALQCVAVCVLYWHEWCGCPFLMRRGCYLKCTLWQKKPRATVFPQKRPESLYFLKRDLNLLFEVHSFAEETKGHCISSKETWISAPSYKWAIDFVFPFQRRLFEGIYLAFLIEDTKGCWFFPQKKTEFQQVPANNSQISAQGRNPWQKSLWDTKRH